MLNQYALKMQTPCNVIWVTNVERAISRYDRMQSMLSVYDLLVSVAGVQHFSRRFDTALEWGSSYFHAAGCARRLL